MGEPVDIRTLKTLARLRRVNKALSDWDKLDAMSLMPPTLRPWVEVPVLDRETLKELRAELVVIDEQLAFFADAADEARFLDILEKRGDVAVADASAWLERHARQRTFVWVHLYDPHAPYEPPEPYASRYADRPYDGEVAWTDELIGRLDQTLTRLGMHDDTLLVLTSDHGEGLGEHGELVHGFFLYQATLRVPLLMRGPGIPTGVRRRELVWNGDLPPTILDAAGARPAFPLDGRSLLRIARPGRAILIEGPPAHGSNGMPRFRGLRTRRYKYVEYLWGARELYDLRRDPDETENLAQRPALAQLRAQLRRQLARLAGCEGASCR
jgi:arylsulfatase A-like enzyme